MMQSTNTVHESNTQNDSDKIQCYETLINVDFLQSNNIWSITLSYCDPIWSDSNENEEETIFYKMTDNIMCKSVRQCSLFIVMVMKFVRNKCISISINVNEIGLWLMIVALCVEYNSIFESDWNLG